MTLPGELPPLWAELSAFSAAEIEAALVYLIRALGRHVNAVGGYWLGAIRMGAARPDDPMLGWRPAAVRYEPPPSDGERFFRRSRDEIDRGRPDVSTIAHARQAGTFRAVLLQDHVAPEWFASPYYEAAYLSRGVRDCVWVICPIGADAECYYAWHRGLDQPRFTVRDRDLLATALLGVPWLHRNLMLSYGLQIAERPLTPTERRVLQLLLSDRTEKQIAGQLGLAPRTTHHHVTAIFRKFGVNNRAGLMALWLGQGCPPRGAHPG